MVHEAEMCESNGGVNSFITLTYRDKEVATPEQRLNKYHIRDDWSLEKRHFQLFMKRLRKERPDRSIKYYHCGEYGQRCKHGIDLSLVKCPLCNVGRPHYHAILFNCGFDDLEAYAEQNGRVRYTSKELESIWRHGFVDVGKVTVQSAAYCARYIMKKVNGEGAKEHYESVDLHGEVVDLLPEYSTMSNGIGASWYEKFKGDVYPSDEVPVVGKGVMRGVPRFYDEKLRAEDEVLYDEVKARRLQHKEENPEEYEGARLESKYRVKKAQISTLNRSLG